MRLSLVSLVPAGVLASLVLLAGSARAHLSLTSPPPRTDLLKQGPCGAGPADPRGPTVATFKPGEKIVVTWNEFVDHPGHFRIALDPDGQDDFFEPASFDDVSGGPGVIVDGIFDKNGGDYSLEIELPNIECDSCVLQVIQVMTDKKPYGDGNDLYYQCADIAIVGEMVGTTGEPGSTGPDTTGDPGPTTDPASTTDPATSGASDPSAGQTGTTGEPGTSTGDPTTGAPTEGTGSAGATTGENTGTTSAGDTSTGEPTTGPGPACGDGTVDAGEDCDDGADNADDASCTSACKMAACGDGQVQAGVEGCDDGNQVDDDACSDACALASCGDGEVQAGEACDDGNQSLTDECLSTCVLASCGDGALQAGVELCDDGNPDEADACLNSCVPAKCGDAVVQAGVEECDDANAEETDACLASCKSAKCGDAVVQGGVEECDDGNIDNTDGCTTTCTAPKSCLAVQVAFPGATDGVYLVDPDGAEGTPGFQVFCDMTTAGGGWTLLERSPFGGLTIGKALYNDVPVNVDDPKATRHRLAKPMMTALRDVSTDMRLDCRGQDYLLTAATNLFNGQGGPNTCFNWTKVLYKEAQLKGNKVMNKTICTWHVGTSEGCAGAWHIDEAAQNQYGCGLMNYPWKGVAVVSPSADTFATDAATFDGLSPVHDCHKNSASRWILVR